MNPKDEAPNSIPDLNRRALSDMGWEERLKEARKRRKEALRQRASGSRTQNQCSDEQGDVPAADINDPKVVWGNRLAEARMLREAVSKPDAKTGGGPAKARGGAEIAGDLFPRKKPHAQAGAEPDTDHQNVFEVFTTPKSGEGEDLKRRDSGAPAQVVPLPTPWVVPAIRPTADPRPSEAKSPAPTAPSTDASPNDAPTILARSSQRRVAPMVAALSACVAVAISVMAALYLVPQLGNPPVAPLAIEVTSGVLAGPGEPVAEAAALVQFSRGSEWGGPLGSPAALAAPFVDPSPTLFASPAAPVLVPGVGIAPDLPVFGAGAEFGPIIVAWTSASPAMAAPPLHTPPAAAAPFVATPFLTLPAASGVETGPGSMAVSAFETREFASVAPLPSPAVETVSPPRDRQMIERTGIWTDLPALTEPRILAGTGFGEQTAPAPVTPGQRPDLVERVADAAPFLVQQTVPELSAADRLRGRVLVRLREGAGN